MPYIIILLKIAQLAATAFSMLMPIIFYTVLSWHSKYAIMNIKAYSAILLVWPLANACSMEDTDIDIDKMENYQRDAFLK